MNNTIINNEGTFCVFWIIGWIFTIGYLKLSFWKGVLAFIIWPYYLGVEFRPLRKEVKRDDVVIEAGK